MNPKSKSLERLIYAVVIILSLIAVGLVAVAPDLLASKVVYQGF
jgi:hypothetical protein